MRFEKRSQKFLAVLMALTLIFSSFGSVTIFADEHAEDNVIYILHTNDMHGRVKEGRFDGMGLDLIAAIANSYRDEHDNVLLFDAGDALHGMPVATLDRGESYVKLMNAMSYDLFVPGNHDFNYGKERLLELNELASFPMIAANVIVKDTGDYFLQPYIIYEIGDNKIGVFGLTTPETLYKSHPAGTEGLDFINPILSAQKMVDELGPQVDVLIALSHLGNDDSSLYNETSKGVAEGVDGIDLIIDGHSHETYENGLMVNNTLIAMAQDYNKNLGVVEITINATGDKVLTASLIKKEDALVNFEPDPTVLALINEVYEAQGIILSEVVGNTAVHLDGAREMVRVHETNLGNLITDSMVWATGADFAFTNGGGIRTSIEEGEITKGDIITVLPFGNVVVTKNMLGHDIMKALEIASSAYPEPAGKLAHVSGLTYTIDPNQAEGERVSDVMIKEQPLVLDQYYIMATNDFLAAGGDEMSMFVTAETITDFVAMDQALINYIAELGTVSPMVEGRIRTIALVETEEPVVVPPVVVPPVVTPPIVEVPAVYVVQSGDVLWRIARIYGSTWQELSEFNQLKNPNLIYPGDRILIPSN